tara:strand:- start:7053 stop:8294 length:1242 start_codon:yes stop_codon:yes gene_type:complete
MQVANELDQHAFEIRQMVNNTPMIQSMFNVVIGMLKQYTELSVKNQVARDDIWWPFITHCYKDIIMYGFCAYYKTQTKGIVYPVHVPVSYCSMSFTKDYELKLTPLYNIKDLREKRIRTYVAHPFEFDVGRLGSPLNRILPNFKRIHELSDCYVDEERRVANPVVMLEDTRMGSSDSIYQAVSAENPDWQSSIAGLSMSARDTADQHAKINQFIASLQENMVDLINHGGSHPEGAIDNLGMRKDSKRKRVNDTHVPLPSHKRPHVQSPANRVRILDFEKAFKEDCPWIFGFPLSFLETGLAKVGTNFKLLEMAAQTGLVHHADSINAMLKDVSSDLFSLHELLISSPMRVTMKIKEGDIDYDDNPASGKDEDGEGEESGAGEEAPLKVEELLEKLVKAITALKDAPPSNQSSS